MKKYLLWILLILTLFTFCPKNAFAINNEDVLTIKVGYIPNYSTINEPIKKGYEGYGYDCFMEIAKYTGWEYEFVPCTWNEGIKLLNEGKIDLFGPDIKSDRPDEQLIHTQNNFGLANVVLLAPTDAKIGYDDYEAFDGKRIGVVKDSIYQMYYNQYLEDHGISANYIYIDDMDTTPNNKADLILTSEQYLLDGFKVVARLGVYPLHFIGEKNNAELLNQMDSALKEIQTKDFMFFAHLFEKYYGDQKYANPVLTNAEQKSFFEHNVVRVGYGIDYAPMQYTNKNGVAAGVCIDLFDLIADKAGLTVEYIPLERGITYTGEDIDLSLSFTTGELKEGFSLQSLPYVERSLMMLGKPYYKAAEIHNLIGIIDYENIDIQNIKNILADYEILTFNNTHELKRALANGLISHVIATSVTIDNMVNELGAKNFSLYSVHQKLPFLISFSDKLPQEFASGINKIIESIDIATKDKVYLDNIKQIARETSLSEFVQQNIREVIIVVVSFFTIIIAVVILGERNKKQAMLRLIEEDSVTHLLSTYKFILEATNILKSAKPNEYMMISIDIDNFKFTNELYGYAEGTRILQKFAYTLKNRLDKSALVARVKADEFVILAPSIPFEDMENRHDNLNVIFSYATTEKDYRIEKFLYTSVGVYYIDEPSKEIVAMMDFASIARKQTKEYYGHTIRRYSKQTEKQRVTKNKVLQKMEEAIVKGEFIPYLQPKVSLHTGEIVGAEALVRWKTDEGMIYPNEFIPIFERNGFIVQLDLYMLEQSCQIVEQFHKEKFNNCPSIAVNLSRVTLLQKNILDLIDKITEKYTKTTGYLEFEITESALASNKELLLQRLKQLHKLGYEIAVDDFGNEYSSLSALYEVPYNSIKLDRSFIKSIEYESGKRFVQSIVLMLKNLGNIIVAEGVETKEQKEFLDSIGCDIAQGYYYAKPMPINEFIEFYRQHQPKAIIDINKEELS